MELYLIRHTKVKIDKNVCYGQADIELAESFEIEVEEIKKKLNNITEYKIFSSPSKRCTRLSKTLFKKDPIIDNRLLELNFGDWELQQWNLINRLEIKNWVKNIINYKCPNGESFIDLFSRAIEFFNQIVNRKFKNILVITHAGIIRSIVIFVLNIPLENFFLIDIDFGSISKITIIKNKNIQPIFNINYINR